MNMLLTPLDCVTAGGRVLRPALDLELSRVAEERLAQAVFLDEISRED